MKRRNFKNSNIIRRFKILIRSQCFRSHPYDLRRGEIRGHLLDRQGLLITWRIIHHGIIELMWRTVKTTLLTTPNTRSILTRGVDSHSIEINWSTFIRHQVMGNRLITTLKATWSTIGKRGHLWTQTPSRRTYKIM